MINYFENLHSRDKLSSNKTDLENSREIDFGGKKLWVTTQLFQSIETSSMPRYFLDVIFFDKEGGKEVASFSLSLRSRGYGIVRYPELLSEKYDFLLDGSISYNYNLRLDVKPWFGSMVLKERLDTVPQLLKFLTEKNILTKGLKVCSIILARSNTAKSEDRKKKGINDTGEWTIKMMERFNRENKENGYRRVGRTELFVRTFQV
jgi:hypothetical protein